MMTGKTASFFLGANTPEGFHSLYDNFIDAKKGDFLWVIKGGPGCGKSSFMRKVGTAAQQAGLDVEYIYCSGDPDSLDGVRIPQRHVAYVDGTSPHVMDPPYPGAGGMYLDLGRFYDWEALQARLPALAELTSRYKALYTQAYGILAAAGALCPAHIPGLVLPSDRQAVLRRAAGAISREIPKNGVGEGTVQRRFLSAFTCEGTVYLQQTVRGLCQRVYTLDNDLGLADGYLHAVADAAQQRGVSAILCPDSMFPQQLEAVLLPELSLAFLATDSRRVWDGPTVRHIRLDAMPDTERIRAMRPRYRSTAKLYAQLLGQAHATLSRAKELHDELEKVYNPHVDFLGIYGEAEAHIAALLARSSRDSLQ